jgi:hypothetical protein
MIAIKPSSKMANNPGIQPGVFRADSPVAGKTGGLGVLDGFGRGESLVGVGVSTGGLMISVAVAEGETVGDPGVVGGVVWVGVIGVGVSVMPSVGVGVSGVGVSGVSVGVTGVSVGVFSGSVGVGVIPRG